MTKKCFIFNGPGLPVLIISSIHSTCIGRVAATNLSLLSWGPFDIEGRVAFIILHDNRTLDVGVFLFGIVSNLMLCQEVQYDLPLKLVPFYDR